MNEPEFTRSEKEIQAEVLEQPQTDQRPPSRAGRRLALFVTLLVIGAVALSLGFGYRYWQELQSTLGRMDKVVSLAEQRQAELRQQLDGMQRTLEMQQQRLAQEKARQTALESERDLGRQQLQQQWAEMRETLQATPQSTRPIPAAPDKTAWLAAEVEYLLQLANYRLLLARDPATAIQALTLADRRLAEAGGAKWQTLRAQLASDINRLRALEMPDPAAIAVRLVNLEQGVNSLRLLEAQGGTGGPEEQAGDVSPSRERSFDTLLRDSWDGLRSVLVIRRHDQPPSIGLPPEQRYFAYQNLRMQLAAARLALLRGDQSQYQASLQQVERWLQEFFAPESPATLEFLRETRELGQIDLRPALPDISATLIAPDERGRPEAGVSAAE